MKSSWKLILAASIGFILGAWIFHTPATTKAQILDPDTTTVVIPGGAASVVGFSCIPLKGETKCYVAKAVR
jgi:hypothetical protein